jgi:hypothetical protein
MAVKIDGTLGIDKIKDGSVTSSDLVDSINLPGSPTVATPTPGTNSNKLATTAYVDGKMVLGTSITSTSGTSIDFTGIPSWVKKITIMFNSVSTNGSSLKIIQLGSGSVVTSGYLSGHGYGGVNSAGFNTTTGFGIGAATAGDIWSGHMLVTLLSGFTYVSSNCIGYSSNNSMGVGGGVITTSGLVDRIRITTVNGTDTFDSGSINIIYEG